LPSVETLGSATVVCTDKTGTLTAGEMTLTLVRTRARTIEVTGSGYAPAGTFVEDGRTLNPLEDAELERLLRPLTVASRGDVVRDGLGWVARGDPTDAALLAAARKAGLDPEALLARQPRVGEVPFSSARMLLASFHEAGG